MALARFPSQTRISFASVGNVEARVRSEQKRISLVGQRGILGTHVSHVGTQNHTWDRRWLLVLHTDGLRSHWHWEDFPGLEQEPSQIIASKLMRELASGNDDATVLAVKSEMR